MVNPNLGTKGTSEIRTDYPVFTEDVLNLIPEVQSNVLVRERVGI